MEYLKLFTAAAAVLLVSSTNLVKLHASGQTTSIPVTHTVGLCDGKHLNISTDLDFFGIIYVDSSHETVQYNLVLKLQWSDPSLAWSINNDTADIYTKYRLPKDICFPDLLIEGSIGPSLQGVSSSSVSREVSVSYRGLVTVYYPFIYTGYCPMELADFPFDTQRCSLTLFSASRGLAALDLYTASRQPAEGAADTPLLSGEEWIMSGEMSAVRRVRSELLDEQEVATVTFTFTMSRRSGFYLLHLSLPSTLVAIVATVGFFTPYASDDKRQEKTRLGMSALVALSVQMLIVGRSLPVTGDVSILTRYNVFLLSVVVAGVLISTATVAVQHEALQYQWTIPSCVRGLCFSCLPTLLCIKIPGRDKAKQTKSKDCRPLQTSVDDEQTMVTTDAMELQSNNANSSSSSRSAIWTNNKINSGPDVAESKPSAPDKEQLKKDWLFLTLVTDRLFLTIFMISIAISIGWFSLHIKNI